MLRPNKLLCYALIHYDSLLTFLIKNDVYTCFNLNGKKKSSSSLTKYINLKNKHRIDIINDIAMFTHGKFISMQHNSRY